MDDLKDDKVHYTRPEDGYSTNLLMAVYDKKSYGTVANDFVVKSELLSLTSKNSNINIHEMNQFFQQKKMGVAFVGKSNPDVVFQLFKAHEKYPIPKFQETIGEIRKKSQHR